MLNSICLQTQYGMICRMQSFVQNHILYLPFSPAFSWKIFPPLSFAVLWVLLQYVAPRRMFLAPGELHGPSAPVPSSFPSFVSFYFCSTHYQFLASIFREPPNRMRPTWLQCVDFAGSTFCVNVLMVLFSEAAMKWNDVPSVKWLPSGEVTNCSCRSRCFRRAMFPANVKLKIQINCENRRRESNLRLVLEQCGLLISKQPIEMSYWDDLIFLILFVANESEKKSCDECFLAVHWGGKLQIL